MTSAGLARAGVAHDLDVLSFGALRDAHELLRLVGFEADAIAFDGFVEAFGETSTGPFSSRPYFISLSRRMSLTTKTGAVSQRELTRNIKGRFERWPRGFRRHRWCSEIGMEWLVEVGIRGPR